MGEQVSRIIGILWEHNVCVFEKHIVAIRGHDYFLDNTTYGDRFADLITDMGVIGPLEEWKGLE